MKRGYLVYWREALVLTLVAVVALADLTAPMQGDQALYLTYGRKIAAGGALYRDVWDIKQPNIFYFYAVALELFGRNEVSPRILEMLWMLALALALQIGLRPYFSHAWTKALVALPTVALYFAVSSSYLGQVEGLIALPLFLSLWALDAAAKTRGPRASTYFILAGAAAGVVVGFKLLYGIIVLGMYLTVALQLVPATGRRRLGTVARSAALFAAGAFVPLGIVTFTVATGADIGTLVATTFVYPGRILREHAAPYDRLLHSALYFVKLFAPVIILTAVGGYVALRRRDRLLNRLLTVWLACGAFAIVVQTWSWWEHHFLLIWLPLGIFATKSFDVAADWADRSVERRAIRKGVALACAASLFLPAAAQPATNLALMLRTADAPWTEAGRLEFGARRSILYRDVYADTAFLREPTSVQGAIFVCGSPLNYVLGKRDQALRADGYSLDLQLPEQWAQFTTDFQTVRPAYVYVEHDCQSLLTLHSPPTISTLRTAYRVRRRFKAGVWYERRVHAYLGGASSAA